MRSSRDSDLTVLERHGSEDIDGFSSKDICAVGGKGDIWHDGALWCINDRGLWTVRNDKLNQADVPPEISVCSGHLSVGDGVMLLAGPYGAAMHDGKAWRRVTDYNDLE